MKQVLRQEREEITAAKEQMEKSIAERVQAERQAIAVEESKKARLLVSDELTAKSNEIGNLQEIIDAKDERISEAQKAHAETMRKQRELDDAKLALDLTVEQRVQASLGSIREKAKAGRRSRTEPQACGTGRDHRRHAAHRSTF